MKVENEHVGSVYPQLLVRLLAAARLTDHSKICLGLEQQPQPLADDSVIIRDHDRDS